MFHLKLATRFHSFSRNSYLKIPPDVASKRFPEMLPPNKKSLTNPLFGLSKAFLAMDFIPKVKPFLLYLHILNNSDESEHNRRDR